MKTKTALFFSVLLAAVLTKASTNHIRHREHQHHAPSEAVLPAPGEKPGVTMITNYTKTTESPIIQTETEEIESNPSVSLPTEGHGSRQQAVGSHGEGGTLPSRHNGTIGNSDKKSQRDYLSNGTPIRHVEPPGRDVVGDTAPLECPPPYTPFSSDLCNAPACLLQRHCGPGTACCFNGCVHTCTIAMDRPPVIDWFEDTEAFRPKPGGGGEWGTDDENDDYLPSQGLKPLLPLQFEDTSQASNLAFMESGSDLVHLPGDCYVSDHQFKRLQSIVLDPVIQDCNCNQGEVVCSIRKHAFQTSVN